MKKTILFILIIIPVLINAQKTIIIKKNDDLSKSIDNDGKKIIITKSIENSDEEGLPDMDKDGEYLTVEKNINNGKEESMYKLTKVKNGKKEVIMWDGQGEMPISIKDKMKNFEIKTSSEGIVKTITLDELDEEGQLNNNKKTVRSRQIKKEKISKSNLDEGKVQLGIMLIDVGEGVVVEEVFKGSVADKAGMMKGDKILKINGDYIFSNRQLINKIEEFKADQKVDFIILRDKNEINLKSKF
jgi:hypothetical protein